MKTKGLLKKIAKPLSVGLLVGALSFIPMKKVDASSVQVGPVLLDCAFFDTHWGCGVEYTGTYASGDDGIWRIEFKGDEYRGDNATSTSVGWDRSLENTTDQYGSGVHDFQSPNSDFNFHPWNDLHTLSAYWGAGAPSGIETGGLGGYWEVVAWKVGGNEQFNELLEVPEVVANVNYQPEPPIVPEPVSSTLFLTGGALLGYRGLRKQRKGRR